jgi:hypothetical protein
LLSSLDIPDIVTIPITPEQYQIDIPKLTELELMQISTPQTLDLDQREFMELYCKLSHLPFPAMIVLAKKEKSKRSMPNSSIASQFACLAFLEKRIVNLGGPKVQRGQFEKRATMLQESVLAWTNWFQLNRA